MSESDKFLKPDKVYKIRGSLVEMPDGTLEHTKAFDFLQVPLDDYSDLEFTYPEIRRMHMHIMKMKTGIQAMAPILCAGAVKCIFRYRCPIVDRTILTEDGMDIDFSKQNVKKFPLLRQCLIERDFIDFKRAEYIEEYRIDGSSPTELGMVNRLAELDLYEYRIALIFANGDFDGEGQDLLKSQVSGVTPSGKPLTKMEIHPAFELKEKIQRMRDNILEAMIGTRREKLKQASLLRDAMVSDVSVNMASLSRKLEALKNPEEDTTTNTIEVEYSEIGIEEE
jgi:hypothetical protein